MATAQTLLFQQNFDSIAQLTIPTNWVNTLASNPASLGWYADSTNFSSGYTNASGMQNLVIKNVDNSTGIYTATSPNISTSGFKNITVLWASRVSNNFTTSGSTTPNLFYSINNGSSWNNIIYTDNAANSTWDLVNSGVKISLPISANNQPSLKLKWEIQIDTASQGTYRIDDVQVEGVVCTNSSSTTNASTCAGTPFLFNNISYNTAGLHTVMFKNYLGCDSSANLNLTILQNSTSNIFAATCAGNPYIFNGNNYSTAGNYTVHFTNYLGCDSAVTLHLSIKQNSNSIINASTCNGVPYIYNSNSYSAAGSYTIHLTNHVGCDSTVTLNLTIKQNSASTINASTCNGVPYVYGTNSYSTAGSYIIHLTNYVGCDSAVTLNLSVSNSFIPSINIQTATTNICNNSTVTFTASILNGGLNPFFQWKKNGFNVGTNSSSYTDLSLVNGDIISCNLLSSLSCVNSGSNPAVSNQLIMHIIQPISSHTFANICNGNSYNFNGNNYHTAGNYSVHLNGYLGCDSIANLTLNVLHASISDINVSICKNQYYYFNGNNYYASGNYIAHFTNYLGCDSMVNLALTVFQINKTAYTSNQGFTCVAAQSGAAYQWVDCNTNSIIQGANSVSYTPNQPSTYYCIITANGCTDTTNCVAITQVSGYENLDISNSIYPNPSNGIFEIDNTTLGIKKISIFDMMGKSLFETETSESKHKTIDIRGFENGMYMIKIENKNATVVKYLKIIVEK